MPVHQREHDVQWQHGGFPNRTSRFDPECSHRWRDTQVERGRIATPVIVGSIPTLASMPLKLNWTSGRLLSGWLRVRLPRGVLLFGRVAQRKSTALRRLLMQVRILSRPLSGSSS